MNNYGSILIVDDNPSILTALRYCLDTQAPGARLTLRQIKNQGHKWYDAGVRTLADADSHIARMAFGNNNCYVVPFSVLAGALFMLATDTAARCVSASEIPSKLADNIRGRICLEMNDKFSYREILSSGPSEVLPKEGVRGRGLVNWHGSPLEFQTALVFPAANDFDRSEKLEQFCREKKEAWSGTPARRIPRIPEHPVWSEYRELPEVQALFADDRHLPVGYLEESAYPYSLDLGVFFCYLVAGKKRSGKQNFFSVLLRSCAEKGGKLYVFGSGKGVLKKEAETVGADIRKLYSWSDEDKLINN